MAYVSPWRPYLPVVLLIHVALIILLQPVLAQGTGPEDAQRLNLNVYLDVTGKALVAGYAENPYMLSFLNSSQYSYENDTGRLYVLTNALTRKEGDLWTLYLNSSGRYEDYRVSFYLPGDFMLKNMSSSQGLTYTLSAANDSLAVDFEGVDIADPVASIEYLQPITTSVPESSSPSYLLLSIFILGMVIVVILLRRKIMARPQQDAATPDSIVNDGAPAQNNGQQPTQEIEPRPIGPVDSTDSKTDSEIMPSDLPVEETGSSAEMDEMMENLTPDGYASSPIEETYSLEEEAEDKNTVTEMPPVDLAMEKIEISSEMVAVMETLTPRERAVLQTLIDRGGRTTQADLRYATRTPRSSLSGIISSLERRKIIIKKESGRTNVIELSDWFLSKKHGL